jgi:hypothetical protein
MGSMEISYVNKRIVLNSKEDGMLIVVPGWNITYISPKKQVLVSDCEWGKATLLDSIVQDSVVLNKMLDGDIQGPLRTEFFSPNIIEAYLKMLHSNAEE